MCSRSALGVGVEGLGFGVLSDQLAVAFDPLVDVLVVRAKSSRRRLALDGQLTDKLDISRVGMIPLVGRGTCTSPQTRPAEKAVDYRLR